MKKPVLTLIILISFAGLFAFNFASKKKESIQGAWILIEGKRVTETETINYPASGARHMKIISENHFATISKNVNNENSGFYNGGSYTLKDGIYTETLTFFSNSEMIGTTVCFKIRLEGNRFYIDSCDENGKLGKMSFSEVWEKAPSE